MIYVSNKTEQKTLMRLKSTATAAMMKHHTLVQFTKKAEMTD